MKGLPALLAAARGGRASPIGLALADEGLSAVQLGRRGDRLALHAAVRAAWPGDDPAILAEPSELRRFLRATLNATALRGRRVVSALPSRDVKLMVLNYQCRDGADADAIVSLVSERVREPIDELVIDYATMRTSGEKHGEKSSLVAVARREAVIDHLERLRASGLHVEALEIAPMAIRRLIGHVTREDPDENALVLHCERGRSELLVLWGRRFVLYRDVDFGARDVLDAVGKALSLDEEEAEHLLAGGAHRSEVDTTLREILKPALYGLAEQVNQAIVYAASQTHGAPIHCARLLGVPRRWPAMVELLAQLLEIRVRPVEPLALFRAEPGPAPGADSAGDELAVATGLALRGAAGDE